MKKAQWAALLLAVTAAAILLATYSLANGVGPVTDHSGFDHIGTRNLWRKFLKLIIWTCGGSSSALLMFFAASTLGSQRVETAAREQGLTHAQSAIRGPGSGLMMLMAIGLGIVSLTSFHGAFLGVGLAAAAALALLAAVRATVSIVAPQALLDVGQDRSQTDTGSGSALPEVSVGEADEPAAR